MPALLSLAWKYIRRYSFDRFCLKARVGRLEMSCQFFFACVAHSCATPIHHSYWSVLFGCTFSFCLWKVDASPIWESAVYFPPLPPFNINSIEAQQTALACCLRVSPNKTASASQRGFIWFSSCWGGVALRSISILWRITRSRAKYSTSFCSTGWMTSLCVCYYVGLYIHGNKSSHTTDTFLPLWPVPVTSAFSRLSLAFYLLQWRKATRKRDKEEDTQS